MSTHTGPHPLLLFCDSARLLRRGFGTRIRDLHLSEPQWRVIGVVSRLPSLSQRDLGLIIGASKGPLAELIERLVAAGWLLRSVDPADRRSKRLHLTPRGESSAAVLRERYLVLCGELAARFGEAGWRVLQHGLAALAEERAGPALNAALAPMALHGQLHLLAVLCRQLRYQLRQWLAERALQHNHWLVLAALDHHGELPQQQLEFELGLAKVALAQALAQMQQNGWLRQVIDGDDRRRRRVSLTPAGGAQWRQVEHAMDLWLQDWLAPLAAADRQQLVLGLQQLHAHLLTLVATAAVTDEI